MNRTKQSTIPITPAMFPCPACGSGAVGTIDTLICRWSVGPDGTVEDWAGNDLDTQETAYEGEYPVLVCGNGHEYTHPAFTDAVMAALRIREGNWWTPEEAEDGVVPHNAVFDEERGVWREVIEDDEDDWEGPAPAPVALPAWLDDAREEDGEGDDNV